MHNLIWFRADLRVRDNTALIEARRDSEKLTAVFLLTPYTFNQHDWSPIKKQFLTSNLFSLEEALQEIGIPLLIINCNTFKKSAAALLKLSQQLKIDGLYFNKQYEFDEQQRDQTVESLLTKHDIAVHSFDDQVITPPTQLFNKQQAPFKVFTPYKRAWLQRVEDNGQWQPLTATRKHFLPEKSSDLSALEKFQQQVTTINHDTWPAGEKAALTRLKKFTEQRLLDYQKTRDFPDIDGTSLLSPYLTLGILSPRQCIQQILHALDGNDLHDLYRQQGASTWLNELIWREFYKQICFNFSEVCKNRPFKAITDKLPWRDNNKQFNAWCKGETGFPIVDAAMRQLNQCGWMHNRLRMISAMFLSKTLFLDWRLGERYFMQQLIDGDFSANNGGWQWSASTGTDAVPYFRIFNPTLQSERFDKDGDFIRRFCPELAHLNNKQIHDPFNRGIELNQLDYPEPIVDYRYMRQYVIEQFKKLP